MHEATIPGRRYTTPSGCPFGKAPFENDRAKPQASLASPSESQTNGRAAKGRARILDNNARA
jgi:hypothetical protein